MPARFALALLLVSALASASAAQPLSDAARSAWGFDRSDLVPHPAVRFGVLPNGMRYAIMRNPDPVGGLAARLRIDVGATAEGPREQGFVHLLEHMIFHGSANLPEGALLFMLPAQGLSRHSDFNAVTDYDQTVYRLDLTRSDASARETALTLMREIAGNLRFTRRSVAAARKVVTEEIAGRDAAQDLMLSAQFALLLPGSAIARGPVAGTPASIRRADPADLQRLYDFYYAPRRATLVIVGDVDPAKAEQELISRFSDWRARAPDAAAPAPPPSVQPGHGVETRLFMHPDIATSVTIASVRPLGSASDSGRARNAALLEQLASAMFNRRLARIAASTDSPVRDVRLGIHDYFGRARIASLDLAARDRDWGGALQLGERELRRAMDQGFSQAEFDEQIATSRAALRSVATPRTSSALADAIVDAAGRGYVFTQPAVASADATYLDAIDLADLNRAFAAAWSDPARKIFVTHHRPMPNAEAVIAAAWRESALSPIMPTPVH